jgi:ketosteroid isomerase-like protein
MIRFSGSLLALAFAAMLATQTLAASTRDAIDASNAGFAAAFNRGDATAAATFYAEDAAVFPPESLRIDGRAGIEAYWKGAIDAGVTDVSLKALEVTEAGDFAFEAGEASLSAPSVDGTKTVSVLKYIVIWKMNGSTWQIYRDIWNGNSTLK